MKLHTCAIEAEDLHNAARTAGVTFDVLTEHGSRSQRRAWTVKLYGSSGRLPGFGRGDREHDAASFDEWGLFLAALYLVDPLMRAGHYESAEHFHWCYDDRYVLLTYAEQHRQHKWSAGYPDASGLFSEAECIGTKGPSNPGCHMIQRWPIHGAKFADIKREVLA